MDGSGVLLEVLAKQLFTQKQDELQYFRISSTERVGEREPGYFYFATNGYVNLVDMLSKPSGLGPLYTLEKTLHLDLGTLTPVGIQEVQQVSGYSGFKPTDLNERGWRALGYLPFK